MEITLKNKELVPSINFLQSLDLKAVDSRHRSKLVKLLGKALDEYAEEERLLMITYDLLDENKKLKSESERDVEKVNAFTLEQAVLSDEEVKIEGGMFASNIDEVKRILEEYDGNLSGKDAEIYDRLLDEFEK